VLQAAAEEVIHRSEDTKSDASRSFTSQNIANMLWALGTLDASHPAFSSALVRLMRPRIAEFLPQELANSVWALARVAHYDVGTQGSYRSSRDSKSSSRINRSSSRSPEFSSALVRLLRPRIAEFLPQELENSVWALAQVAHYNVGTRSRSRSRSTRFGSSPIVRSALVRIMMSECEVVEVVVGEVVEIVGVGLIIGVSHSARHSCGSCAPKSRRFCYSRNISELWTYLPLRV
jgi:hypothetical protein